MNIYQKVQELSKNCQVIYFASFDGMTIIELWDIPVIGEIQLAETITAFLEDYPETSIKVFGE